MRVTKLLFNAGTDASAEKLKISPGNVTVFIGPNNGGKSASLRDIFHRLTQGTASSEIFQHIEHSKLDQMEIDDRIASLTLEESSTRPGHVHFGYRGERHELHLESLRGWLSSNANGDYPQPAYPYFFRYLVLNLNGQNRLNMVSGGGAQNLREKPQSTIAALFKDDDLRHSISSIVHAAFGRYLVVDATTMGQFQYAFSDVEPSVELARSFSEKSIEFFAKCQRLDSASDGTKAFIGILAEVMAGSHDILLMDEPEAFLHPALAFLLGREITKNISDEKQMFVATHSPHFLMGCMSVGGPVDIVRLTYRAQNATERHLPGVDLRKMMNDPLLKSIGVVGALFFESAIVVEADSDRAFYEEVNSRLHLHGDAGAISHTVFLNAHNKQEAVHIARVLRNVGIPAAIILDLDWIKEDGKVAQRYLAAAGMPAGLRQGTLDTCRQVRAYLEATGSDYKNGGISRLAGQELATATAFFSQLERYGLFTVRNGELENWLPDLSVTVRKDLWLGAVFDRMGSNSTADTYVKPTDGDVWDFLRSINSWVRFNGREGMDYVDPAEL